jgi:hypothetical protein
MADNTDETKPAEDAAGEAEGPAMSSDQSFTYWLVMLPFVAIAGVFIFEYSKTPEPSKLINAAGAVVVGIFIASMVNVLSQGSDNKEDGDAPKPEGSS